jgi:branched-chain amino acid transport system substrate-binding protein
MTRTTRRTLLKAGAAFAGASAIGFPATVRAQADKIKIGHLTPLTGFLGALGTYAQLGIRLAQEEINAGGGVMGRELDILSEDSVNPATASTKAQRMLDQDGVAFLMGEINSASALTIMQVAERNKRLFLQIGARSDALRGKNCNKFTFHIDIPNTVMVNAVGKALVRENMVRKSIPAKAFRRSPISALAQPPRQQRRSCASKASIPSMARATSSMMRRSMCATARSWPCSAATAPANPRS